MQNNRHKEGIVMGKKNRIDQTNQTDRSEQVFEGKRRFGDWPGYWILPIFLCLFVMLFTTPGEARQAWLTWNTRSGLPDNDVTCLAIMKGKIAVGTPKGIAVFLENRPSWINLADYGENFKALVVRCMDFDLDGNLWAATPNGLAFIELGKFPDETPRLEMFGTDRGLSTIDVEVVQIVDRALYVGCFGGWLFRSIVDGGTPPAFLPVQKRDESPQERKFMDVGISALAMDFPGDGIFSTKGRSLLNGRDGSAYLPEGNQLSDWIEDFWCFQEGGTDRVITLAQNHITLIQDRKVIAALRLPDPEAAVSCITTCPDEDFNVMFNNDTPEQTTLRTFLGKRILYVGTKGQGVWRCDEGKWTRITSADAPLPSDNIKRIHYLPGAKRIALLTDAGLTMFGTDDANAYDEFKTFGVGRKTYARTYLPFMSRWGPSVVGYPSIDTYPIEPHIAYRKLVRGRDLWVSHDKGISRFVFPQAFFLGSLQINYRLSGRFENPLHDPTQNLKIEDNSTPGGKPPGQPGERIWHHYCMEQPTDTATVDLTTIFTSIDRKTLVGPLNQLLLEGPSPGAMNEAVTQQLEAASGTLAYPPVPVFSQGNSFFDIRGHQLYSIDSLSHYSPLHPIPGLPITDLAVDAGERCWAVIGQTTLVCLDEPASVVPESSTRFDASGNHWYTFAQGQLPWPAGEKILCVRRVGVDLYFGTRESGLFILPRAHLYSAESIPVDAWIPLNPGNTPEAPDRPVGVIDCMYWRAGGDSPVALLHQEGLSVYDGKVTQISVPKRTYTCMTVDRTGTLWLGSLQGLLKVTPDRKVISIPGKMSGFHSDRIVALSAAPDEAKYPFLIAMANDHTATLKDGVIESTCRLPQYQVDPQNPYRLSFGEPDIMDAQLGLWDGKQWDFFKYPGIRDLLFEEMYLWSATSWRVNRYFVPTIAQIY
jgi:hypothetical protein